MKFCAVICEYNPFHNGHRRQLEQIRLQSGCDKILCLMSGDFTQRGEAAVAGKYMRARHALMGGADVVLELPTPFAVAPAELFAQGAVHILAAIPAVEKLAFGCESGTKEDFLSLAEALASEDKPFQNALKENMAEGGSYIRARNAALFSFHPEIDEALLSSPNNILGGEYCRALRAEKSKIEPLPIPRTGGAYGEETLRADFSSAASLRLAMGEFKENRRLIKRNVPAAVYADCPLRPPQAYANAVLCALVAHSAEEVALTPDCAEGLENRLKMLVHTTPDYNELLDKAVSKRYTRARIRRILAQNFLGVTLKAVRSYLTSPLYCNVLAVKREGAEEILSALSRSKFPVLVKKSDISRLEKHARACLDTDLKAAQLYAALSSRTENDATLFL